MGHYGISTMARKCERNHCGNLYQAEKYKQNTNVENTGWKNEPLQKIYVSLHFAAYYNTENNVCMHIQTFVYIHTLIVKIYLYYNNVDIAIASSIGD